ncbi:hypothetical protein AAIG11_08895 [Anoxynatronum sibiricum]|uniref:Uncharacterized protein n=1 Tax=Anoxynatronum sibiricum TaxID=210623 RepID=A0ABU9VTT8_9CLOT
MKVVGHTPRQVGIGHVLEHGQHSIEHLSGYTLEIFGEEAAMVVENHVWNTPTLAIVNVMKEEHEIKGLEYIPPRTLNSFCYRKTPWRTSEIPAACRESWFGESGGRRNGCRKNWKSCAISINLHEPV